MTVVCGGGSSEPKAGADLVVFLSTSALSVLASRYIGGWAGTIASFIPGLTFDLPTFCATDPPADPSFTGGDALAIIAPIHPDKVAATEKFVQLLQRFAWYDLCQCTTTGLTPTPPSAPVAPSDLPGLPTPPQTAQPCGVYEGSAQVTQLGCRVGIIGNQAPSVAPCPTDPLKTFPIPAGALRWRLIVSAFGADAGTFPGARLVFLKDDDTTAEGFFTASANGVTVVTEEPDMPFAATKFFVDAGATGGIGTQWAARMEFYCAPSGATAAPCCPPDELTTGLLQQILQSVLSTQSELAIVSDSVELLQRQVAPFAFIEGTAHNGLTGEGEITFTTTIVGIRLQVVDSLEGTVSVYAGHPETLFNLGWFRWGNGASWRDRQFIDAETILSTPYAASSCTKLAYSLPPGTEVDVVELWREP